MAKPQAVPWVLLRGLTREAGHWGAFPACLASALGIDEGMLHAPDLPGNGLRWRENSPTRVEAIMAACRAEVRAQGVLPPYHLLALSLGGMVATAWALSYPDECQSLVLINSSLKPDCSLLERMRPQALRVLPGLLWSEADRRESSILRLTSADPLRHAEILSRWRELAAQHPVSRWNALRQLLAAARFSATEAPSVPTLILASNGDRIAKADCSARIADRWGAMFMRHPSAGHDLPLDAPDWVADQVRRWSTINAKGACDSG